MIDAINAWAGGWTQYFGFAVIQNTLFLAVIFLLLRFKRDLPANVKHLICLVGLIKLVTPPFIPAALQITGNASQARLVEMPAGQVVMPLLSGGETPAAATAHLGIPGIVLLAWIGFGVTYLLLSLISTLRLKRAVSTAVRVAYTESDLPAGIEILKSSKIAVPLTLGLFSNRVYVPAAWDDWTDDCRKMIVAHEMAHMRRRDGVVQVLQVLVRAVYFFHPLVWLIDRRVNQYREMACDDAASRTREGGPETYSKYLLRIAETTLAGSAVCGSASALLRQRNHLLNRVKYQMREGTMQVISARRKALVIVGLLLLVVPMSWYCSNAEQRPEAAAVSEAVSRTLPDGMKLVKVTVNGESRVTVDGRQIALSRLEERLRERVGDAGDESVILLGCDDGVKMGIVHAIREQLVDMNLRKVIFSQDGGGELTLMLPGKGDEERLQQMPRENVAVLRTDPFGKTFLDNETIEFSEITEAVRARLAENDKLIISIQTVGVSPYDDFATLLALVKAAGATRISIGLVEIQ